MKAFKCDTCKQFYEKLYPCKVTIVYNGTCTAEHVDVSLEVCETCAEQIEDMITKVTV